MAVFAFLMPPTPTSSNACRAIGDNEWPFPELTSQKWWKESTGHFKGWAPGSTSLLIGEYRARHCEWLPSPVPPGFQRWHRHDAHRTVTVSTDNDTTVVAEHIGTRNDSAPETRQDQCPSALLRGAGGYNPVNDPLRISNMDLDILESLKTSIDSNEVTIKHVVMIQMESLRKDMFPLQQGSPIHQLLLATHPAESRERINRLLSELTPNAERITGLSGGFTDADGRAYAHNESSQG